MIKLYYFERGIVMNLWIDDIRPAPQGYKWCKSVNEAIKFIEDTEKCVDRCMDRGHNCFLDRDYAGRNCAYDMANKVEISLIDIDHDAGDFVNDGGDYIRVLDWLEATGRNYYSIRIHSMNPVGVENMRRIIQKNGWREVR